MFNKLERNANPEKNGGNILSVLLFLWTGPIWGFYDQPFQRAAEYLLLFSFISFIYSFNYFLLDCAFLARRIVLRNPFIGLEIYRSVERGGSSVITGKFNYTYKIFGKVFLVFSYYTRGAIYMSILGNTDCC